MLPFGSLGLEGLIKLGPAVQSIVSLTSSLVVKMLTVLQFSIKKDAAGTN